MIFTALRHYGIEVLRHYGITELRLNYGITALRHLRFTVFNYGDYGTFRNRNNNFDGNYNCIAIIEKFYEVRFGFAYKVRIF